MKKQLLVLGLAIAFVSCKNDTKTTSENTTTSETEVEAVEKKEYPASVLAVMNAHGGLDQWNAMNNICFAFDGKGGEEVHTVSLKIRKSKIETDNWTIGSDGETIWVLENEEGSYKGNAAFYNNLMFYFYSMPFVLSDDGIVYTDMPQKELEGKMYNATKISFNDGVGYSSTDDYILFSDPKTNQMSWLAYTATGASKTKSDKFSYIKYGEWQNVNGLQLPETLTWYNVENNEPKDKRNDLVFKKVTLTETIIDDSVFAKPEGAK